MQMSFLARSRQFYTVVGAICTTAFFLFVLSITDSGQASIARLSGLKSTDVDASIEVEATLPNTDLVLFAYYETDNAKKNLQFFVDHGLHGKADFIFIINGDELSVDIPVAENIQVIRRANTCYDLGAYGEVLEANNGTLKQEYKRFIMLNGSIRGPFLPHWSRGLGVCWSDVFFAPLTDEVKLSGMSANCNHQDPKHIQSMILSTDKIGLDLIMPGLQCASSWHDAVYKGEVSLLNRVIAGGYSGAPIYSLSGSRKHESWSEFWDTCDNNDVFFPNHYGGMDVHPFDTVFVKSLRLHPTDGYVSPFSEAGQKVVNTLTEWADNGGYSSYDYCR